jgi:hypothetical protein
MELEMPGAPGLCRSLASTVCPACGQWKKPRQTLCGKDYASIPRRLQKALYNRVGAGYEEAVESAMKELGITEFKMPPQSQLTN